jgi:hypothetical protein
MLRVLSVVLGAVDALLDVRWGERCLERLAERWQSRLTNLDEALAELEKERRQLQAQAEALAIHAAAIYLGGRSLARDELRFDPADSHDEEILDATIDLLVKARLASVETEEIEPDRYIYHLEPDWPAIRSQISDAVEQAEPQVAEWFREGLKFIDEAFLSPEKEPSPQGAQLWSNLSSRGESP